MQLAVFKGVLDIAQHGRDGERNPQNQRSIEMGLFGNDEQQDQRLDALESHVRALTETVQNNQLDTSGIQIQLIKLEAQIGSKLSEGDIDPTIIELGEQLGVARRQLGEASAAAAESWSTLQAGVTEAAATLRAGIQDAAEQK